MTRKELNAWNRLALGLAVPILAMMVLHLSGPSTVLAQNGGSSLLPPITDGEVRGILAVRGDETIVAAGDDQRLTPASVLKLIVGTAILDALGPDHRFRTEIFAWPKEGEDWKETGRVSSLIVIAGADPTWSKDHFEADPLLPLKQLARQVVASGVRHIESAVVVDVSRVKGRRSPNDWPASDASLGYGASPSALALHDNRSKVRISPGPAVGMQARIEAIDPITWRNQSITVPAERDGRGSIEFDLDWDGSTAVLRGEYPISERSFTVDIATPNPNDRAADALMMALGEAGVLLPPVTTFDQEPISTEGLARVAVFESPPLSDVLVPLLADSNNFVAEMLLRSLGHHVLGEGRLDIGIDAASNFLIEKVGLAETDFVIDDGSGLSPFNLMTPSAVVQLLQWAWQQPWRDQYFEAMASESAGTVRDSWPRAPALRGKTGTLRQTQCLAGVLLPTASDDSARSEPIFFAWMVNHTTRERRQVRREIIDTLWRWSRL